MFNLYKRAGELMPLSQNLKDLYGGVYIRSISLENEETSFLDTYSLIFCLDTSVGTDSLLPVYVFHNGRFTLYDHVLPRRLADCTVIVETDIEEPGYYFSGLTEVICRNGPSFEVLNIY